MVSLGIATVFGTVLLFNAGLAKPRDPHSPRFSQSSDNSVGDFVLWSCTATAELHKNNGNKNVIHIATAPGDFPKGSGAHHLPNPPPREDDAPINNINIIKLNTIPYRNRGKQDATVSKKTNPQSGITETIINEQKTKYRESSGLHAFDSPLKTIKVNTFRKDMPLLFREKPKLPQVDPHLMKEDESTQHSSEITVIKA